MTKRVGLAGDGRPFSLFLLVEGGGTKGLEGATASLLGAGVNCEAVSGSCFGVGVSEVDFLPKKPRMLRCWLLPDCEPELDFFSVAFGVAAGAIVSVAQMEPLFSKIHNSGRVVDFWRARKVGRTRIAITRVAELGSGRDHSVISILTLSHLSCGFRVLQVTK